MEAFPLFQRVLVVSIFSVSSAVIGDFGYFFDNLPPMTNVTAPSGDVRMPSAAYD